MTTYGLYGLPEPERPKPPPSKWRWVVHLVLFLSVALVIVLVLLSRQGGNSDSLKQFLETYISENTGYHAEIGTLNALSFYPVLGIDVDNLLLRKRSDESLAARFGQVKFAVGFWTAASGQSSIRVFSVKDGHIGAGLMAPKEITIDSFAIRADDADRPILEIDGAYGQDKMHGIIDLKRKQDWFGNASYIIANDKAFTLDIGPFSLDSILGIGKKGGRLIAIKSLEIGADILPLMGEVEILRGKEGIHYNGTLRGGASHIHYALEITNRESERALAGDVIAQTLDLDDVLGKGGFLDGYAALMMLYRGDHGDDPSQDRLLAWDKIALNIAVEKLSYGQVALGNIVVPVTADHHILHIGNITGHLAGGAIQGEMTVNAENLPATLDASFQFKKEGRDSARLTLESQAADWPGLWNSLQGGMTIMATADDPADMVRSLWGGRLGDALWGGDADTGAMILHCGMADMSISGRDMMINTLFLDAPPFSFIGHGKWGGDGLDVTLASLDAKPKAIQLKGMRDAPAIRVNQNPARGMEKPHDLTPHFGLSALGLDMDHPCGAYLKAGGETP